MKYLLLLTSFSYLAIGCRHENKIKNTYDDIVTDEMLNGMVIGKDEQRNVNFISDTVNGKYFGNRFIFYKNKVLKQYSFQTDSVNATYIEEYDSTGELKNIIGKPIVYHLVSADEKKDSLYVKYYLSNFSYQKIKLELSDSLRPFEEVSLKMDTIHKYLEIFEYWKNIKDEAGFF